MSRTLVGFHGKLPGAGDFVQRRLATSFVEPWDAAMQSALSGAVQAVGDTWRECFLAAPAWRFAFATHVCGPLPWIGVVAPSHDRVGRLFPLVLAAPTACGVGGWPWVPESAWFATLEAAIVRGRAGLGVSMFDALVAMLPDPRTSPRHLPSPPNYGTRSFWWRHDQPAENLGLAGLPDHDDYLRLLGVGQREAFA